MKEKNSFLVVGADSLVGGGLARALAKRGCQYYATTRRRETLNERRIFLNFESDEKFKVPVDVKHVFIVAAATNYDRCETDPLAHKINVELTPKLVDSLLQQGVTVTFISTNSVFGGEQPWPNEDDPHAPGIAYAKQKDDAEKNIIKAARELKVENKLNIVRLTKIMERNTSPVPSWFENWTKGISVQPFHDLIFAPMTVEFVGEALATIGEKFVSGNLHLSGADNVSYVDFAIALAKKLNVDPKLITPTTSMEKGIHIAFKPSFSGLGMKRTTELTGIKPQGINDVVDYLVKK